MDERRDITESQDTPNEALTAAQDELKRAYLLLSFGNIDDALQACKDAGSHVPDHYLPPTVEGTVLIAGGRIPEALSHFGRLARRHPGEPLVHLHFAEACFLAGRFARARKELARAETLDADGTWAAFRDGLREAWDGMETSRLPPPLKIPSDTP